MTLGRARRGLLTGTALAGLGLALLAPRAQATPADWAGSHSTTASSTASPSFAITAEFHHDGGGKVVVSTWLTTPAGQPVGCLDAGEAPIDTISTTDTATKVTTSSAAVTVPCNGTYDYRLDAKVSGLGPIGSDDYPLSGSIDVAVDPDPVTGVTASPSGDGSSVTLSWSPASNPAPDFLGYQVERQGSDGDWAKLATPSEDDHTFKDDSPPSAGGAISYRVRARRAGPHGVLLSDGGKASATLPTTTTAPATTVTTAPGTPTTGGAGGTPGTPGTGKNIPAKGPIAKGTIGGIGGISAPRLGGGTTDFPTLPDGSEGDFQTELNYNTSTTADGLGSGSEQDGLSSAFYEQGSGRGMAIPVATGFVLAAWAFHLRFLARAARPAKVTAPRGRRFS